MVVFSFGWGFLFVLLFGMGLAWLDAVFSGVREMDFGLRCEMRFQDRENCSTSWGS